MGLCGPVGLFGRAEQGAELVARWVAQVSQVELATGAFAPAGWVFAGGATVGHARGVPGIGLLSGLHREAQRAAVAWVAGSPLMGVLMPKLVPLAR